MKKNNNIPDLEELGYEEIQEIAGGESVFYWLSYGVGATLRFVGDAIENSPDLPSPTVYK